MKIVDAAEMRRVESAAIGAGTPGFRLMRRAGTAAAELIAARMRQFGFSRIVFLCGGGNNGGDALVAATLLAEKFPVAIWLARPLEELRGEAAEAAAALPPQVKALATADLAAVELRDGDLLVDGLLGIGLRGEVRPPLAAAIRRINDLRLPVIALDVPSGMDSDTGAGRVPVADALHAFNTITFGLPKRGLFTASGIAFSGSLYVAGIGLDAFSDPHGAVEAFCDREAMELLPRFANDVHKNRRGELLVVAGSRRYPGAAGLTATAGLYGGAGLVRSFVPCGAAVRLPLAAIPHELAATGQGGFAAAPDWSAHRGASALAAGSGWGDDVPSEVLSRVLDFPGPLVLDADALNLVSRRPELWRPTDRAVLTPHPGEAERLRRAFGIPEPSGRETLAAALAERLGAVVVLKGARSVVADPSGGLTMNISGSAALATAGSGDVLTGLIGALLANGVEPASAARLGVFIHGRAGELLGRGAVADDLPRAAAAVMAKLEKRLMW